MRISKAALQSFEQRYRATFVNSLAGFRQAVLVGTKSKDGVGNLAIFNSLIHLGANPALFGLINRPDSVQRDTLQNIVETKSYTLNFVSSLLYEKAHQTSARYDSAISEFDAIGFHEDYLGECFAPAVKEASVKIEMHFEQAIEIAMNRTILIIGSIQQVDFADGLLQNDGYLDLGMADILISQGLDAYFSPQSVARMPYAKP